MGLHSSKTISKVAFKYHINWCKKVVDFENLSYDSLNKNYLKLLTILNAKLSFDKPISIEHVNFEGTFNNSQISVHLIKIPNIDNIEYRLDLSIRISGSSRINPGAGFLSPEGPKAWANKTCINCMIFILLFVENCNSMLYMIFHSAENRF